MAASLLSPRMPGFTTIGGKEIPEGDAPVHCFGVLEGGCAGLPHIGREGAAVEVAIFSPVSLLILIALPHTEPLGCPGGSQLWGH